MKKIITLVTSIIVASSLLIGATTNAIESNTSDVSTTTAANGKSVIAYFPNWGMYNQNHQMITVANQEPDKFIEYLDYINIMTYDSHGTFDDTTNHQSAIYPNPNDPSSTSPVDIKNRFNTQAAMKLYTDTYKIAPEKLNVGTPFYSRDIIHQKHHQIMM